MKQQYIEYCVAAAEKYGCKASVMIAQCILESSGFVHMPAKTNNGFGITKSGGGFRSYSNKRESCMDYARLVTSGNYARYTRSASTPEEWIRAICKAGYNSSSSYPDQILSIIKNNNLTQYDEKPSIRLKNRTVAVEKEKTKSDIVDVALSQVGYHESGNNQTKYNEWFGMNGAKWCHIFVSWCAYKAGVSSSVVPKTASTDAGMDWFKKRGLFKYKGHYSPKRGDIVYFKTGRSHVGIVEYVSGDSLHTIEGNAGNAVKKRTYSLENGTITGYGVPKYESLNTSDYEYNDQDSNIKYSGSSSKSDTSEKEKREQAKQELALLNSVLSRHSKKNESVNAKIKKTNFDGSVEIKLIGSHGKKNYILEPVDEIKLTEERKGSPSELEFKAYYGSGKYILYEGDPVLLVINSIKRFYGFVFTRSKEKDGLITYTAYDQLRYLKNKDTIVFKHKTASDMLKIIARRFGLKTGSIDNTKYAMSKVEDNSELFDIIDNALEETTVTKATQYILYDDVGKLTLKNVSKMKVNSCLIDEETAEDYSYKTSIDSNVYNQIKLYYENEKTGKFDIYIAKSSKSINKWGMLQYLEKIDYPLVGKLKSRAMLQLYNQKMKSLSIKGVIGNLEVRGGSLVPVLLNLGEAKIANYMMVDKVTHSFKRGIYTMDLEVSGGGFSSDEQS